MSATILVVDDETAFAEAVALRLTRDGHAATVAGSLGAARAALAEGAIDVMLLDMRLPDGTGLDLLGELGPAAPATVAVHRLRRSRQRGGGDEGRRRRLPAQAPGPR